MSARGRGAPSPALIGAATGLLRALGATWRVRRLATEEWDRRQAAGERCIFALWHARMLPLIHAYRDLGAGVLVSRSRDGDRIAALVERLGYVAARGSSTRGGREGFLEMVRFAAEGRLLGIMPDGPRGPAEVAKPGVVRLASRTGLPVVPIACAARPVWVMRSWDGFRVPPPFATVWIAHGEPLRVPPDLDDAGLELWRARCEAALREVTAVAARAAGEGERGALPLRRAGDAGPAARDGAR